MTISHYFHRTAILLLPIAFLVACGDKKEERKGRSEMPAAAQQAEQSNGDAGGASSNASSNASSGGAQGTVMPASGRIALVDPQRGETEALDFSGGKVAITYPDAGGGLTGEMRSGGRSYLLRGKAIAEVRQNENGSFKLKSPDGKLLWKVKIADDKIKVSDNEENEHPYVLRMEGEYVKVKEEDAEIGRVRFRSDSVTAVVNDASGTTARMVKGGSRSGAYGVLLMNRVPYEQRLIIMAELLALGR